ncbi:MAG TPA: galactokinase family protein [Gemmatimonadaceae bacterium]|nr:galactokinase family protein [Gemmatimonadaceae bacterium]
MPVVVTRARETLGPRLALLERCEQGLRERSAIRTTTWGGFVPGRIEILGKHVDYAGGRSAVCAVDRGIAFAATARDDPVVRVSDAVRGETREAPLEVASSVSSADWGTYVATVARRAARDFPATLSGVDVVIASDLPAASGLSSSSALLIASFLALAAANGWFYDTPLGNTLRGSATALAEYLAAVESGRAYAGLAADDGVGTLGGSQDHTAILCSARGCVSRFEFLPTRHLGDVELPSSLTFAVAMSGVHAAKTADARERYNRASQAVSEIVRIWQEQTRNRTIKSLRRAVEARGVAAVRAAIRMGQSDAFSAEELLRRLDHFMVEMELHEVATRALAQQDWGAFGEVAARSQRSAEELLGNQVPETTELVRLALAEGALAASAFGAGFGGSVWALVEANAAQSIADSWREAYGQAFPDAVLRSTFFVSRPWDAAHYIA